MARGNSNGSVEPGEKFTHDDGFTGVDEDRRCTDICMLIFFILFLIGMLAIFFLSLVNSNPKYLYIPTDHRGLLCGYNNKDLSVDNASELPDLSEQKELFWIRPGVNGYSRSFCVKECPSEGLFTAAFESIVTLSDITKGFESTSTVCKKNANTTMNPTIVNYSAPSTETEKYYCPYATKAYFHRCLPTSDAFLDILDKKDELEENLKNISESINSVSTIVTAVQDVYRSVGTIAACVAIALVLALVWLCLLRCCAGFFVWLTVLLTVAALGLLTYLCYNQSKNNFDNSKLIEGVTLGIYSEELNQKVFKVLFYIMIVLDVIFVLLLIFLCDRIKFSVRVIKTVSEMFFSVPSLFFFPIFIYIIMFIWWIYVIGVATVLFGAGKLERNNVVLHSSDKSTTDVIEMKYDTVIQGFAIYHFVGFLWVSFFISALSEMSIAGVVAEYYFSTDEERDNLPRFMCLRSFLRSLRFHTGSLAFGSLIITICRIIRAIIEYFDQKTKDSQNTAVKCLIKCCKCCCWCFEKFLKYLNRNTYVMIAMHGYNFFGGCKAAFGLLLRNAARATAINWVGDFTLFLGRVLVAALVSSVSIFILKRNEDITFFIVPAFCIFVMSWIASGAFTSVFEMGIDATFMCFLEDEERNDGGPGQARHTPDELREYMNDSQQVA